MRFGVVLGNGGALKKMLLPFKLKLGAYIAGEHYWPWIAIQDLLRAIEFLLGEGRLQGPVNCVSPSPVTASEFGKELCVAAKAPLRLPIPGWLIGFLLGQMGRETLLSSQKVLPEKLEHAGFPFTFKTLKAALEAELGCSR